MGYGDGSFLLLCRVFSPTHSCQVYLDCSLHLCVEFLFLVVRSRLPPPACRLSHFLTHTTCPHTTYSHTTYSHTTCNHTNTHTLPTHNLLTHTTCPHTACHHNLLTHNLSTHNLSPHDLLTRLYVAGVALMTLGWLWWRARFPFGAVGAAVRGRRGAWRHRPPLCVAGAALTALGWLWWHAWFPFGAVGAAAVCLAGVALGDIDRHFTWQAWRLATSTSTLRGRRGTYGTGLVLVARLVPFWRRGHRRCWHGRRGAWRH